MKQQIQTRFAMPGSYLLGMRRCGLLLSAVSLGIHTNADKEEPRGR